MRRALKKMDETAALAWLEEQNRAAITPIPFPLWILDIDNTVKLCSTATRKVCLGVEVLPGEQDSVKLGMPGLWRILEAMPRLHWPTLIQGDCAYGVESIKCPDFWQGLLARALEDGRGHPSTLYIRRSGDGWRRRIDAPAMSSPRSAFHLH